MSFSATRLTCFALLVAIEDDLLLSVLTTCESETPEAVIAPDALAEAKRRATFHASTSCLLRLPTKCSCVWRTNQDMYSA